MDQSAKLITGLGEAILIPDLAFDEAGFVSLSFDDIKVTIERQDEAATLVVIAEVGPLPNPAPTALFEMMLALSHLKALKRDGTIGLDPAAGKVLVVDRVVTTGATVDHVVARVRGLIATAETWQQVLASAQTSAAAQAALHAAPADVQPIRV